MRLIRISQRGKFMLRIFAARALCGVSAMAVFVALPAHAQDTAEKTEAQDGDFLGTIDIGKSTRAVRTDTATPVTVIDQDEIEDRQASTIAELLDSVPGVTLINGSTPIGSGINIRGFGANGTYGTDQKVAFVVDGATTGSEEIYRVGTQLFTDPLLYKRAEVIRGTVGSFEWGSGIIGGVVLLETNDASNVLNGKPGFRVSQTLSGQTNKEGFATSTTVAAMPTEQFEFLANYTWRTQGTQEDGHGDPIGNSAFDLPSFLVKGAFHFGADNAHTIAASFNQTTTADRDVPYDSFNTTAGLFGNVDRDTKSQVLTVSYGYDPVDNDAIDLQLLYTYANQEIDQTALGTPISPALLNADHRYETSKITLKNAALFATGPIRHNLHFGVEYIHKKRADANSAPGGTDNRMAAFAVDEIGLFKGFTLSPAIRWETSNVKSTRTGTPVSYNNEAWMGGVSARYELPFGLAVFGSWARTRNLPIIDDLDNTTYMNQPEKSRTWEAGGSFDRTGLLGRGDHLAIKVNYYDTELTDNTAYSGVREIYLDGFEIEASYATAGGLYFDFNATIPDGERLRTTGVIDDWTNLPQKTYMLSAGKRFGKLFDVRWESTLADDLEINGTQHEGFDVHNLRATITPSGGILDDVALRLSVENIFDTYYQSALSTRPATGRNFKASISKLF
jgi:hemoglobin/transferrin/lactoferrin receptor protein